METMVILVKTEKHFTR